MAPTPQGRTPTTAPYGNPPVSLYLAFYISHSDLMINFLCRLRPSTRAPPRLSDGI